MGRKARGVSVWLYASSIPKRYHFDVNARCNFTVACFNCTMARGVMSMLASVMTPRGTCPVCLEDGIRIKTLHRPIVAGACAHRACASCSRRLSTCPLCRIPLRGRSRRRTMPPHSSSSTPFSGSSSSESSASSHSPSSPSSSELNFDVQTLDEFLEILEVEQVWFD